MSKYPGPVQDVGLMDSGIGTLHPTPYTPCPLNTLNTTHLGGEVIEKARAGGARLRVEICRGEGIV